MIVMNIEKCQKVDTDNSELKLSSSFQFFVALFEMPKLIVFCLTLLIYMKQEL